MSGLEITDLVVGNGNASDLQGTGASYSAMVTPAASGTVTVDIAAGAAEDSAGNPSVAATQFSITADTTAPTVTITSTASAPVSEPFSITVTFSESVTGFELDDLVVVNGSASDLQGTGASYSAMVAPAASGTVTVDIAAGAAEDSAGNPSAAATQFSIAAELTPVPALPAAGTVIGRRRASTDDALTIPRGGSQQQSQRLNVPDSGPEPDTVWTVLWTEPINGDLRTRRGNAGARRRTRPASWRPRLPDGYRRRAALPLRGATGAGRPRSCAP